MLLYMRVYTYLVTIEGIMKPIISLYILLFVLAIPVLNAQTSYVREIPIELPQGISDPQFTPKAVFPCSDNSVIIVGEIMAVSEIYQIYSACIIKLDAQGNRLWQSFALDGDIAPLNVIGINIDENNSVYYIIEYRYDYCIYKTDTNGNSVMVSSGWLRIDNLRNINRAIRLSNDEIIAVGKGNGPNPYYPGNIDYYAFFRMSASGDSLVYQQYPPGINNVDYGANADDMELDSDGLPIAICSIDSSVVSVVKFGLNGNIIQRNDWDGVAEHDNSISKYRICRMPGSNYSLICFRINSGYKVLKFINNTFEDVIQLQGGNYYNSALEYNNGVILAGYDSDIGNTSVRSYNLNSISNWSWNYTQSLWIGLDNNSTERLDICPDSCIVYVADGIRTINVVKFLPNGQVPNDDEVIYPVNSLISVYPNPFNHFTTVSFSTPKTSICELIIYNIKGQAVKHLVSGSKSRGIYKAEWKADDDNGKRVSSGVYFYRLNIDGHVSTRKMVLMK